MDLIQVLILAIIQGITEWLPVSSSAHLALAEQLLGIQNPVFFDVMLHVGTLLAVIVFMRSEILAMLRSIIALNPKDGNFRLALLIIFASIPTAIIGFAFRGFFASMFSSQSAIGIALLITGIFLFICERERGKNPISPVAAFIIGIAQGIAVAPGISRSGSTIGTALLLGVEREKAAKFSFLLSIPAVIGAAAFEAKDAPLQNLDLFLILVGILVSAIVGYLTMGFLLNFLKNRGLKPFSYYCVALGIVLVLAKFLI